MSRSLPARWYASALAAVRRGDKEEIRRELAWARRSATPTDLEQDDDYRSILNELAGAGLLEQDARTIIEDVRRPETPSIVLESNAVETAATWIADAKRLALLVGAGASFGPPTSLPLTATLLNDAWDRGAVDGNRDLANLRDWCQKAGITNIEDVLSAVAAADLVLPYPQTGYLLYRMLQAASRSDGNTFSEPDWDALEAASESIGYKAGVVRLLEIVCGQMAAAAPNAGHQAIVRLATRHHPSEIITTNYDLCLEKACMKAGILWQYTWKVNTGTDERLRLSKVHGSISLFACRRCSRTRELSVETMEETRSISVTCERGCGAAMGPLIVPPVRQKALTHPSLIPAWYSARLALIEADTVVVAGYGFADADDYIASLFALDVLSDFTKRVIVFSVSDRATSKLQRLRSRYALDSTVREQLVTVIGPAEDTLPVVAERVLLSA